MQIFVRSLNGKTSTLDINKDDSVHNVKTRILTKEGLLNKHVVLKYCGKTLLDNMSVSEYGINTNSTLEVGAQLLGGGEIDVVIRPRVQKETWSLYWKESMHTHTDCLKDFSLKVDDTLSVADLQREIGSHMNWKPLEKLYRLEGFNESWQRMLCKGREMPEEKSLADCGIQSNTALIAVRKELLAEGWAVHVDDDDISTSDESDV